MKRKKKRNLLKRNSGFIVGCMLTAGISFLAADIVMSQKMELFTALFESEDGPIVIDETNPPLTPETEITKVYETDAFTVTASGTVIKGVETEPITESEEEASASEAEESGSEAGESDAEGTEESAGNDYSEEVSGGESSDGNDSYGDTSYDGDSYYDDSYDDSYYDDSYNDSYDNSYNDSWYDEPNIEIEDSDNGDYSYDDYYDDSWNDQGNTSDGSSDVIVEGEPSDILLPGITTRYISESELYNYSDSTIRYIRNEIFALHGRIFKSEDLREYFMSKSWYTPMYAPEDFDACMFSILNKYEIANLEVILAYEEALAAAN